MSVVVGCISMDGVFLLSDARISYRRADGSQIRCDHGQKLFVLAPGSAIGYVGGCPAASEILVGLVRALRRRARKRGRALRPYAIVPWMPRFLRFAFRRLTNKEGVRFMLAISYKDRPQQVSRERVHDLFKMRLSRGGVACGDVLFRLGFMKNGPDPVTVPGSCEGGLYIFESPDFEPKRAEPLVCTAIGEGDGAVDSVESMADVIMSTDGGPPWQASHLIEAVSGFIERTDVASVGGLYPVLRVRGDECTLLGHHSLNYKRGTALLESEVELVVEDDCWIQRNRTNGHCMSLMPPWELRNSATVSEEKFEYLDRRARLEGPASRTLD
jgi:hypothetical protein